MVHTIETFLHPRREKETLSQVFSSFFRTNLPDTPLFPSVWGPSIPIPTIISASVGSFPDPFLILLTKTPALLTLWSLFISKTNRWYWKSTENKGEEQKALSRKYHQSTWLTRLWVTSDPFGLTCQVDNRLSRGGRLCEDTGHSYHFKIVPSPSWLASWKNESNSTGRTGKERRKEQPELLTYPSLCFTWKISYHSDSVHWIRPHILVKKEEN